MPAAPPATPNANALDLCSFIAQSPSPFHAVETAAQRLGASGFREVAHAQPWVSGQGCWFVKRGGSLIAWRAPEARPTRFRIVGAHTDSPNLRIKPQPDRSSVGVAQLGVEVYGGVLLNSWLDRDLGISGRVVHRDAGSISEVLFCVDEPLLRIPQLAIHLDRDVNERGLILNRQQHLTPMWSAADRTVPAFRTFLSEITGVVPQDILAWDAMLHDTALPVLAGRRGEYVSAPRLDNLLSCHAAITALGDGDAAEDVVQVVALFDHEEVGSTSSRGADGSFLGSVLERISASCGIDRAAHLAVLAASHGVSADGAHATNPNYPERHEPEHRIALNGGPVVKVNTAMRYATDARSAAPLLDACARVGVEPQWFVTRGDIACGSTIGPMTSAHLGIDMVDVGVAQLAMHSIRELCGANDVSSFTSVLAAYLG